MKLSKNNLRRALYALIDVMISGSDEFVEKAIDSLDSNTLEIEGYERSEWTKFDKDDSTTFPPKGKFLYFDGFGIAIGIHLQCEKKDGFAHIYRKITHWRPLPKPPQEETK